MDVCFFAFSSELCASSAPNSSRNQSNWHESRSLALTNFIYLYYPGSCPIRRTPLAHISAIFCAKLNSRHFLCSAALINSPHLHANCMRCDIIHFKLCIYIQIDDGARDTFFRLSLQNAHDYSALLPHCSARPFRNSLLCARSHSTR